MGWRGVEGEMPAGMLFRKMYCAKCGEKLKRLKYSEILKKGDKDYSIYLLNCHIMTVGMTSKTKISYVYICPKCHQITTYDEQLQIRKRQKKLHSKIIDD